MAPPPDEAGKNILSFLDRAPSKDSTRVASGSYIRASIELSTGGWDNAHGQKSKR